MKRKEIKNEILVIQRLCFFNELLNYTNSKERMNLKQNFERFKTRYARPPALPSTFKF
jgi:hypothetical protein